MLDARRKYGKIKVYEANTGVLRPLHPMFRKGAIPVEMKLAYDTPETIRELFTEYTRMLVENEPAFQTYLDLQDYAAELADPLDEGLRARWKLKKAHENDQTAA